MALPRWSLNEDQTRLFVDFPTNPPVRFNLRADEVDDFLSRLAETRMAMKPAVPMTDPVDGTRIVIATNGRFYVQRHSRGVIIALLHPGLRWVGMMFGHEEAKNLINIIRRHLPKSQKRRHLPKSRKRKRARASRAPARRAAGARRR